MSTLLVTHIGHLLTMDPRQPVLTDAAIVVEGGRIASVGRQVDVSPELMARATRVIDARHLVIMPGLVNTHHHMFQSLTRCLAVDHGLFDWLRTLYPIWARLDGEAVYASALTAMAELVLGGCTTTSDHLYLFPNGAQLGDEVRAAREIGIRFHAARGSMSVGESAGGLPPDRLVEREDDILADCARVIEAFHDPAPGSMLRVVVAPCSPFSVSPTLMRESAALARHHRVQLHTHLAETRDEEEYCQAHFGRRPVEFAEEVGWLGDDVWHAHAVHLGGGDIDRLAQTRTGVAHCPSSNMRLASGIAPVRAMRRAGVPVGLGVDGSASNDSGHLLAVARQSLLLQRVQGDARAFAVMDALALATTGGAEVLGRDDIGVIATGMCADFVGFRSDAVGYAGARHDLTAALVLCAPQHVDLSVINGRVVVQGGAFTTLDLRRVVERHDEVSRHILQG